VLYVSSLSENPGPFELWQVAESPDGTFTINNVGLAAYATSGEYVTSGDEPTSWDIVPTNGGDQYSVKLPGQDLFWTVDLPVIPSGNISLNSASGADYQQFTFIRIDNT
jgi:hypothetical protein